ncbi:hypothetical protein [Microbacterium sp.]|uniref:hypothetical protein n=1 Tax=Microbacterium sp. TaxID=51671 RepID=UPI002622D2F5|nr:hypothetical protein [Microbacterium sp.]MCV0334563.1 hypothetical protein [Microbacterium sp.]MCV0376251.1 hypothetical protein [Microbacterium sp.]MCV0389810.1 hypothetical protein [Microbacterium sp.]MCV0419345.1 hypothetical protein [Microbacterium sp.]MCV0421650.1 hypothetical protein [Microbacterium sp.]
MRLLTEGWCERGPSLSEAAAAVPPPESAWWDSTEFVDGPDDDRRAAINLWLLTGLTPERRDVKGERDGDGRVDLLLRPVGAPVEVVEVLTTLDRDHSDAEHRAAALVAELNGDAPPALRFPIHLDHGWEPPLTRGRKGKAAGRRWRAVVERLQREARDGAISAEAAAEAAAVFPGIGFHDPIDDPERRGFWLSSWGAGVRDSGDVPYLERLSAYLAAEERPVHHVAKLAREAAALGAQRRHLYLLVASAGQWGDLLPTSPSWFTDGTFTAPEGLTDLWLDGGTGYIMRWRRETGWTYHETG